MIAAQGLLERLWVAPPDKEIAAPGADTIRAGERPRPGDARRGRAGRYR